MNLICPHCQKTIAVAETLGGQTTKCPLCSGPFTVPVAPSSPPPDVPKTIPMQRPFELPEEPSAAPEPTGTPSLAADYRPRFMLTLHPEVIRWTVPACLVVLFFFLFFPWLASPLGGKFEFTQGGLGAAFGLATPSDATLKPAPFMILYFLVVLLGVLVSGALLAARFLVPRLGSALPPIVQMILGHRTFILGGLALLSFVFLGIQLVMGLPAEAKDFAAAVPEAFKDMPKDYDAIMRALLHRTVWVKMAFTINLIAVLAALADFWLERRVNRPWPKVVVEW